MPLFITEHEHPGDRCPAGNPETAQGLLALLSKVNAEKAGIRIEGDAVARGKHHLYAIVEGPNEQAVRQYFAPFAQFGSLQVTSASTCEEVVERGAC